MIVRDEDVRSRTFSPAGHAPAISQHAQSRPAIQDELRTIRRNQLQAGRIAAIAPCRWIHGRRGPAHTPETQFSDWDIHDAERKSPVKQLPRTNTLKLGSSFHGRSRWEERQCIPAGAVSNCVISSHKAAPSTWRA